jgi:predicted metalloprotease with PDZ domain
LGTPVTELRRPRQHYQLRIADTAARYFEVVLRVDEIGADQLQLWMASWVPGSYLMREYAGHVLDCSATADGTTLAVEKGDKSTWLVECAGYTEVEMRYRVYAPELTVRTSDITHDHSFVHPPSTFMVVAGREHEPCSLRINAPTGWDVATSLVHVGEHYLAEDIDRLLDCPLEIGTLERRRYVAAGRPHEFAVYGSGNHDLDKIVRDSQQICEKTVELFGEVPFDRYLFLLHLTHDRGGGLEHMDCSALAWPKLGFRPEKEYHDFLALVAHEYFHVWNVKRIRPQVLWQYRYDQEVYTRLLWVFEGITSYYDELIPMRAGCYGPRDYARLVGKHITDERNRPGRAVQSMADSSFDTWIKLYRPTPDTLNSQSSYYQRGALVALLLDLFIRRESGGERSLDDFMRYLWNETYKKGRGIEENEISSLIEAAVGVSVESFLEEHVLGTGDLTFDDALATVGLQLKAPKKKEAWVGASITRQHGESRLGRVRTDGPAHAAGWMADDVVIALDGHRVRGDLAKRIELYSPGERANWTSFRRDRMVSGEIEFTNNPVSKLTLGPIDEASDAQQAAFAAWAQRHWEDWSIEEAGEDED